MLRSSFNDPHFPDEDTKGQKYQGAGLAGAQSHPGVPQRWFLSPGCLLSRVHYPPSLEEALRGLPKRKTSEFCEQRQDVRKCQCTWVARRTLRFL